MSLYRGVSGELVNQRVIGVKRILEESATENFPGYLEIFPELLAR